MAISRFRQATTENNHLNDDDDDDYGNSIFYNIVTIDGILLLFKVTYIEYKMKFEKLKKFRLRNRSIRFYRIKNRQTNVNFSVLVFVFESAMLNE